MNKKTTALIIGVTLLLLAFVGIGYGLWFEVLEIEGTVETGELDVEFSPVYTWEWFGDGMGGIAASDEIPTDWEPYAMQALPIDEAVNPGLFEIKHDGLIDCMALIGDADLPHNVTDDGMNNLLSVSVVGAYPSYHCLVVFDVTNVGTVPVHLSKWMHGEEFSAYWVEPPTCYEDESMEYAHFWFDGDGEGPAEPVIQLHNGEHAVCSMVLHFDNYTRGPGEPPYAKGAGLRLRSFANTGGNEVYFGDGDLGVGVNRDEYAYTWEDGSYPVSFTYDGAGTISATMDGMTIADRAVPQNGCAPGDYNRLEILVLNRDGGATNVEFNNVDITSPDDPFLPIGMNMPSVNFYNADSAYVFYGDFSDGVSVSGEFILGGQEFFGTSQEYSKLEIQLFCDPGGPVVQENMTGANAYLFNFFMEVKQWNESGMGIPYP